MQGEAADSWRCKRLVVAHDLIERLAEKLGTSLKPLGTLTGAQLAGCVYRHPLFDRTSPVVVGGDYITTDSGTGLVHTAPGHGTEDYQVWGFRHCTLAQHDSRLCLECACVRSQALEHYGKLQITPRHFMQQLYCKI